MQDILSLVMEKKFSESLPIWMWCQLVGWETQTHTPTITNGRLYARAASDTIRVLPACYYGLKIIKENWVIPSKRKFASSLEQTKNQAGQTWTYFEHVGLAKNQIGVSHQMLNFQSSSEKGNITEYLHFAGEKIQVLPVFTALQVVYVKIWYQNQQQQSFQVTWLT